MPRSWPAREYHDPDTGKSTSDSMRTLALHSSQEDTTAICWLSLAQQAIENGEDMSMATRQYTVDGIEIYTITRGAYTVAFAADPGGKEICWLDFFNGDITSHREDLIERCIKAYGLTK